MHLYIVLRKLAGIQVPGLGYLLRRCKSSFLFDFRGQNLYFEPTVASSYWLHIVNTYHEPETHAFLDQLYTYIKEPSIFLEVGANIGIFLLDMTRRSSIHCIALEPSPGCVNAIHNTMHANDRTNYTVINALVGDKSDFLLYDSGLDPQGASVYTSKSGVVTRQMSLDELDLESQYIKDTPIV